MHYIWQNTVIMKVFFVDLNVHNFVIPHNEIGVKDFNNKQNTVF